MNSERRKSLRHNVHTKATLVCDGGLRRLTAYIIDLSETGARVRLAQQERITTECYILFEHRMEPCRVVWQSNLAAGLRFAN